MPVTGRPPKDNARNRVAKVHDWLEVDDVPYDGERPWLPGELTPSTHRWWHAISTMPHCVMWREPDWQFALDTARIHDAVMQGDMTRANELRVRENQMGTTWDARRNLRIRYVAPADEADEETETPAAPGVASLEDRRRRLMSDAS